MTRERDFIGRSWVCSCGWIGGRDEAYEHAQNCRDKWSTVGPRYRPNRHEAGEQVDLMEWSE